MIFERLNTGGTILQPQEIRACVYHGEFNELLSELVLIENWRKIFGKENTRMKEQELILRFFCLYHKYSDFKKILKTFLNTFMSSNKSLQLYSRETLTDLFQSTIDMIHSALGDSAFRTGNRLNAAVFDSVMIGLAKRISTNGSSIDTSKLKAAYDELRANEEYKIFVSSSTSSESSVKGRIELAIEVFKNI